MFVLCGVYRNALKRVHHQNSRVLKSLGPAEITQTTRGYNNRGVRTKFEIYRLTIRDDNRCFLCSGEKRI